MLGRLLLWLRLAWMRRAGLQIGEGCQLGVLSGWPHFGSEPYLITIGDRVAFAAGVAFITHDGGTWVFRHRPGYGHVIKYGRITIHDNCVIGYGAILMPGVEIGPNTVIAAGSVVGRSIPANSLAAGSPARVIMPIDEYSKQALQANIDYDRDAYRRNKRTELLRLYPPSR